MSLYHLSGRGIIMSVLLVCAYSGNSQQGQYLKDVVYDTGIIRITNARQEKLSGVFPQYSKRQAWNANETKFLLMSDDGSTRLYDSAYHFIKTLVGVGGEDVFWNPQELNSIIYCNENSICSYNISTGNRSILKTFPEYTFANTRGEGNLSMDGRSYAFVGQLYDAKSQKVIFKKLVLFDMVNNKVVSELRSEER